VQSQLSTLNAVANIKRLNLLSTPIATLALWLPHFSSFAAAHTWTGNGPNALWSTPSNWENSSPPFANESPTSLIFPAAANRRVSTNNIARLQVSSLALLGAAYTLRGFGAGTNVTLLPGGVFGTVAVFNGTEHTLDASLNLTLTGTNSFAVAGGASLSLAGRVTGNGSLAKTVGATLRLRGSVSNTFTGATFVRAGTLELFAGGTAIPGPLWVGTSNGSSDAIVSCLAGSQIVDTAPVTIYPKAKLQLNAFNATIGQLSIQEGVVDTGSGVLTTGDIVWHPAASPGSSSRLLGTIDLPAPGTNVITVMGTAGDAFFLEATLRGGSANTLPALDKRGPGQLHLMGSNSFNGMTRVSEGILAALHPHALGATNQGVIVASNAVLRLRDAQVKNEALTLDRGAIFHSEKESSWSGPITFAGDTVMEVSDDSPNGKTLTLHGNLSGPGGFTKTGVGVLALSGTAPNTYSGVTAVQRGELRLANGPGFNVPAIPGLLRVGGSGNVSTKRVTWMAPGQLATNAVIRADVYGLGQGPVSVRARRSGGSSCTRRHDS
jgi:autotransporter-associated beta strand protein